jgi:hypothetical protein
MLDQRTIPESVRPEANSVVSSYREKNPKSKSIKCEAKEKTQS